MEYQMAPSSPLSDDSTENLLVFTMALKVHETLQPYSFRTTCFEISYFINASNWIHEII